MESRGRRCSLVRMRRACVYFSARKLLLGPTRATDAAASVASLTSTGPAEPPRHGGDLVVDDWTRQVHRVMGVDQAPAGDDVGTGGADGGRLQGLLVAALQEPVRLLSVESPGAERRHAELVTHLGRHGGHQGALDAAQREGGAHHVEDAEAEAEDEARARRGDLERGRHAEELGQSLHHGARPG